MFRHPKYYKELRKLRNRELRASTALPSVPQSDQAISLKAHDGERERAPDQGLKRQATSRKPQAPSDKHQAPSDKHQA
jgi:hypothetical protein